MKIYRINHQKIKSSEYKINEKLQQKVKQMVKIRAKNAFLVM